MSGDPRSICDLYDPLLIAGADRLPSVHRKSALLLRLSASQASLDGVTVPASERTQRPARDAIQLSGASGLRTKTETSNAHVHTVAS